MNHRALLIVSALLLAAPVGARAQSSAGGAAGAVDPAAGAVADEAIATGDEAPAEGDAIAAADEAPAEGDAIAAADEAPADDDAIAAEDTASTDDDAAAADAEMAALRALEEAAVEGNNLLDLDRAVRLLGAANPWRTRIAGALGVGAAEWPASLEAQHGALLHTEGGLLPFPVESVAARYDIPVEYNEAVAEYLAFFQGPGRKWFARWIERSGRWVPLFRRILREHDVPEDLVYLAMIESGFSMQARSWAAAVGPWQFVPGTGAMYGLRNDFWVDERQDFEKSTRAAAQFLKRLHEAWGDWYLAWAGYNAGPGRVKNAIERFGTRDFWELAASDGAFRKETQHYVPKLIAAALISKHPEHFGFDALQMQAPLEWETVELKDATDLAVIARCAGVSVDAIKELNPELRRWATPPVGPGEPPYRLRLPKGTRETFAARFAEVKPHERLTFRGYKVRPGDTLSAIALAYDTTVDAVMRTNHIKDARALRIGQELIIPVPPHAQPRPAAQATATRQSRPSSAGRRTQGASDANHHVLQAGETLGHVALRYGVSVERLKRLNGIRDVRKLQVGQRLRIR